MIDQAFILAAGKGTRLRPLTGLIPKPLLPLAGKPLLGLFLDHLAGLGVRRAGINIHHLADQVSRFVAGREGGPETLLYEEKGEILGTGGGLGRAWRDFGNGPLLVISPKIMFDFDLGQVAAAHLESKASVSMVLTDRPGYNRVLVRGGRIVGFREDRPADMSGVRRLAYTSVQVVEPEVFEFLPKSGPGDLIEAYREMLRAGHTIRAHLLEAQRLWLNLATAADYLEFHRRLLVEGRGFLGFSRPGPAAVEETAELSGRARVEGFAYLGPGVRVGPGALIRDSVLLAGARVEAGAEVVRVVAGPGAALRGPLRDRIVMAGETPPCLNNPARVKA